MFDRLEQIDECVVSNYSVPGRLVRFDVTRIPIWVLENGPYLE